MIITPADKFIDKIADVFSKPYMKGILLMVMVCIAMIWVNSSNHQSYHHFFETLFTVGFKNFAITESLHVWINDALMAVFFLHRIGNKARNHRGRIIFFEKSSTSCFCSNWRYDRSCINIF